MRGRKTYTVEEAKKNLENYCAYQERCHHEVKTKLRLMNMIPEAQDIIITHLITHDYLNEQRFSDAFVRGKFKIKKWGRRRLISELKARQISSFAIKQAMKQIKESDYLNTFEELALKRFNAMRIEAPQRQKRKLADYLLYRGWESHLVYDKVNELFNKKTSI